jgi:hypothetical protein
MVRGAPGGRTIPARDPGGRDVHRILPKANPKNGAQNDARTSAGSPARNRLS